MYLENGSQNLKYKLQLSQGLAAAANAIHNVIHNNTLTIEKRIDYLMKVQTLTSLAIRCLIYFKNKEKPNENKTS